MDDIYVTPPPEPGTVRNPDLGVQGEFDFDAPEDDADHDFPTEVNDEDEED